MEDLENKIRGMGKIKPGLMASEICPRQDSEHILWLVLWSQCITTKQCRSVTRGLHVACK